MHSRAETPRPIAVRLLAALLGTLLVVAAGLHCTGALAQAALQPAPLPARQAVLDAAAKAAADPDLGKTEKSRQLKFKDAAEKKKKPDPKKPPDDSLAWLGKFIQSVVEGARLLVWALAAMAIAFLVVGIRRWIRIHADAALPRRGLLPSHVQSLDIRPESLPTDIGAAAAMLWQRGEHLPALSLLYRGALSRLVHGHDVPIRAASTEGECVALAEKRLNPANALFVARLVTAWQLAVYGGRLPQPDDVLALCGGFAGHLGVATPREARG